MKKILVLLIAALVVITISCSDKGGGGSSSGFPTIPYEDWAWPQLGINTLLLIWQEDFEKENYVDVEVMYFNEEAPQSCELKLDNNTIIFADSSDWHYDIWYVDSLHVYESYYTYVDTDDIPWLENIHEGQDLDYYLKINNATNTGSLEIPYQPYGTFPDFDVEENYHFGWTIQENPDFHYIFLQMEDDEGTDLYKNWQLSGRTREYTISKSLYQNFVGIDEFWCCVQPINYSRKGSFLAFSGKYDGYEEGWKSDTSFDRELHRKRVIKALLNDLGSE